MERHRGGRSQEFRVPEVPELFNGTRPWYFEVNTMPDPVIPYSEYVTYDEMEEEPERSGRKKAPEPSHGQDWRKRVLPDKWGSCDNYIDISLQGSWTLSSCKSEEGYGIHELLDDDVDKYWQSDGPQPHTVTIEFNNKVEICFIMMYLDYKNDESYTPAKILIQMGSSQMQLDDGREYDFTEPCGWQAIDMRSIRLTPAKTFVLQLQILQNHQNGRDTHVRHIRIIGPSPPMFYGIPVEEKENMNKTDAFTVLDDDGFMNSLVIR